MKHGCFFKMNLQTPTLSFPVSLHKARVLLHLAGLLFLQLGCSRPSQESHFHSDSSIKGPSYSEVRESLYRLAAERQDLVKVEDYGTLPDENIPLMAVSLGREDRVPKASDGEPRPFREAVLITGVTHGNEYLGIEDKLPSAFAANSAISEGLKNWFDRGGIIYMIPIANPYGYIHNQRENKEIDLNRDYPLKRAQQVGMTQYETRAQLNWLEDRLAADHATLRLSLDYHCCASGNKADLIYPWGYSFDPALTQIPSHLRAWALNLGRLAQGALGAIDVGNTVELLGYAALGASDDHHFETHFEFTDNRKPGMAFTFEGLARKGNDLQAHLELWSQWFGVL